MQVVEILMGLPGSGKSSYAREKVGRDLQWLRFCRTFFRSMVSEKRYSKEIENLISLSRNYFIKSALTSGYNVIIDGVNSEEDTRKVKLLVEKLPFPVQVVENDSFLEVPLKELLERNKTRHCPLDEDVIHRYYLEYEERIKQVAERRHYA